MARNRGYILLYRGIQDNVLWKSETFSRGQAWVDLLLMANHEDKSFLLGNEVINVNPGEVITSELKLMNRWKWGKEKLRKFLKILETLEMIDRRPDSKKTIIYIKNYSKYQGRPPFDRDITQNQTDYKTMLKHTDSKEDIEEQTDFQTKIRPISDRRPYTNNTLYEYTKNTLREGESSPAQNDCKSYGTFKNVFLSDKERESLFSKYPDKAESYIIRLSCDMESKGHKYNNHYATIIKWIEEDKNKQSTVSTNQQAKKNDYEKREYSESDFYHMERKKLGLE